MQRAPNVTLFSRLASPESPRADVGASRSRTAAPHQIRTKDAVFKVPARNSNLLIFRSVLAKRILGEGGRRRNASGNHQQTFLNNKSQSEPLRRAQLPAFIISEGIARENIESVTSHSEITLRKAPLCLNGVSGECQESTPCAFTLARTSPLTARNSKQALDYPSQTHFARKNR